MAWQLGRSGRTLLHRLRTGYRLGRPLLRSGDGTDLSYVPGPGLSGLFDAPSAAQLLGEPEQRGRWGAAAEEAEEAATWESYALSEAQLEEFQEQGFLANVRILSEAQCDALAADVQALLTPGHPAQHLWYAFHPFVAAGAWRVSFAFHDIMWSPRLRIAAYQLLGGPVRFLHDQVFCKPPRSSRRSSPSWFGFHQDFSYWSWTTPMAHLTCWVALDDATASNGCLQYVPGSHRWGLLPPIPDTAEPALDSVRAVLTPEQCRAVDAAQRVEVRKGCACFHHPLALHGSDSNTTAAPRRALAINMIRDGVRSNCEAEPASLGSFPFIPQGQPMGSSGHENDRMYPLLLGPGVARSTSGVCRESTGPGPKVLDRLPRLTCDAPGFI